MNRIVEPEWLDDLASDDPLAMGSRRDLQWLNAWMGNARTMGWALRSAPRDKPNRVVELGAGDGHFLCRVAQGLRKWWRGTRAVLLDRRPAVSPDTLRRFEKLGWQVETVASDVFDWLRKPSAQEPEVFVANLFLHHFSATRLAQLLNHVARRADILVAIEPRRSAWSLVFSRLVGLIGCNRVTRHDAPVSVRAGFRGKELSQIWAGNGQWSLEERPVGLFSHLFVAHRTGGVPSPGNAVTNGGEHSPVDDRDEAGNQRRSPLSQAKGEFECRS